MAPCHENGWMSCGASPHIPRFDSAERLSPRFSAECAPDTTNLHMGVIPKVDETSNRPLGKTATSLQLVIIICRIFVGDGHYGAPLYFG